MPPCCQQASQAQASRSPEVQHMGTAKKASNSPKAKEKAPPKAPTTRPAAPSAKAHKKANASTKGTKATASKNMPPPKRKPVSNAVAPKSAKKAKTASSNSRKARRQAGTPAKAPSPNALKTPVNNKKRKSSADEAEKTPPPVMKKLDFAGLLLTPGQKSTWTMANGLPEYGCDHTNFGGLIPYHDRRYFSKERLALENHPQCCTKCTKSLLPGKGNVPIKDSMGVYACRNAINHRDHVCVFCLCTSCLQECKDSTTAGTPPKRQRKATRKYLSP